MNRIRVYPPERQSPLPSAVLAHFLRQIQGNHIRTPSSKPLPLHYNSATKSLEEYRWPFDVETGQCIPPDMLEAFRRTHCFRPPSCLCAFLDNKEYTEAIIGIVEAARGDPDGSHDSVMNGQYVAACARQRCGYFLCLEKFYMLDGIMLQECPKRESPLHPEALNYISDLRGPSRSGEQSSGLSQILSEPPAPTRRGRTRLLQMKPEVPQKAQERLMRMLVYGMSESSFWKTFVQCFVCQDVMFRMGMFSNHKCAVNEDGTRKPRFIRHPYVRLDGTTRSRFARPGSFRARLNMTPGDYPEMRPIRRRSRSLTPTEVASNSDTEDDLREADEIETELEETELV